METARTPEEIAKKFDALPAEIKSLIYSAEMLNTVERIGEKYKLHVDQLGLLESQTADVMIGFSKPENFVSNLSRSVQIEVGVATAIAAEINDQLFLKIRESLKTKGVSEVVQEPLHNPPATSIIPPVSQKAASTGVPSQQKPIFSLPETSITASVSNSSTPFLKPLPDTPVTLEATKETPPLTKPRNPETPNLHPVEKALSQRSSEKTEIIDSTTPAAKEGGSEPKKYALDPYREPIE
ncbi:MAG: hypothetical protein KGJ34_00995 [Patescibacteria group bacterium]|nr:hypothetical protein [Patescibacteria group bacterium]